MVYLYKDNEPDPLEDGTHLGELVSEVANDEELVEYVSGKIIRSVIFLK